MLWLLLAIPLVSADNSNNDYSNQEVMFFLGFLILIGICVAAMWSVPTAEQPRVIRAEIILPRNQRESYNAC
jgi:hypothetical protein